MRTFAITVLLALAACAPSTDAPLNGPSTPEADHEVVRASLTQALSHAPEKLEMRAHADGSQHLRITGGFAQHTVLIRGDAGVTRQCVSSLDQALQLAGGEQP